MKNIYDSFYSEYFSEIPNLAIYLCDLEESSKIFSEKIDSRADSYFRLTNDSWLIQGKSLNIGNWREPYDSGDNNSVKNLLKKTVPWQETKNIYFIINKNSIIKCTWDIFLNHWDLFLNCEYDCPIIISPTCDENALLFTPLGTIFFIKKSQVTK